MLGPKPQPDMAGRTEFTKAIKYSAQCVNDGFVWMEPYFAIGFAPYWPDGQTPAQFAASSLVANPAVQTRAQNVQLGLAHCAFQTKQQPVIERRRVVHAVGVSNKSNGQATQIEYAIPVGVIARQAGNFQPEDNAEVAERQLGSHASKAAAMGSTSTRQAQILTDPTDLLLVPAQGDSTLGKCVLTLDRFTVVLDLINTGLADVNERGTLQMAAADLVGGMPHSGPPVGSDRFPLRLLRWRARACLSRLRGRFRPVVPTDCPRWAAPRRPGSIASLTSCFVWRSKASMSSEHGINRQVNPTLQSGGWSLRTLRRCNRSSRLESTRATDRGATAKGAVGQRAAAA